MKKVSDKGEEPKNFFEQPLLKEENGQIVYNQDVGYSPAEIVINDREMPQKSHSKISGAPGPLQFGLPYSDGIDPGVIAVSNAIFNSAKVFDQIPLSRKYKVFKRRVNGEVNSEWTNSFPTTHDVCDCCGYEPDGNNPYPAYK